MKNVAVRYLLIVACVLSLGKLGAVPEAYGLNLKTRYTQPVSAQLVAGRERRTKPKKELDTLRPFVYSHDVRNASEAGLDADSSTFYTIKEAAKILQIDVRTLLRAIEAGTLQAFRFAGKAGYRITDAQLRAYLDSKLVRPAE